MTAVGFVLFAVGLLAFVLAGVAGMVYPARSAAWELSCTVGAWAALAMIIGWLMLVAVVAGWLAQVAP